MDQNAPVPPTAPTHSTESYFPEKWLHTFKVTDDVRKMHTFSVLGEESSSVMSMMSVSRHESLGLNTSVYVPNGTVTRVSYCTYDGSDRLMVSVQTESGTVSINLPSDRAQFNAAFVGDESAPDLPILDRIRAATPYGLEDHTVLIDAASEMEHLQAQVARWKAAAEAYERGTFDTGDRLVDEARREH